MNTAESVACVSLFFKQPRLNNYSEFRESRLLPDTSWLRKNSPTCRRKLKADVGSCSVPSIAQRRCFPSASRHIDFLFGIDSDLTLRSLGTYIVQQWSVYLSVSLFKSSVCLLLLESSLNRLISHLPLKSIDVLFGMTQKIPVEGFFQLWLDQEVWTDGLFGAAYMAGAKHHHQNKKLSVMICFAARRIHHTWEALIMEIVGCRLGVREAKQRLSSITGLGEHGGDIQAPIFPLQLETKARQDIMSFIFKWTVSECCNITRAFTTPQLIRVHDQMINLPLTLSEFQVVNLLSVYHFGYSNISMYFDWSQEEMMASGVFISTSWNMSPLAFVIVVKIILFWSRLDKPGAWNKQTLWTTSRSNKQKKR